MNKLFLVAERDIHLFIEYKFMLVMRGIWFVAQIALFGLIASRMVIPDLKDIYFQYYAAGVVIMTLYSTAVFIGYDIFEEAEHGVFEYLLSIPVSRKELVLGRAIGGGVRSFLYVGPLLAFVLILIGITNPLNLLIAFVSLFLFAFGVSGMSITIAVALKSSDRFDIFMGVFDALIVRLSTAMYPYAFVQQANPAYASIVNINPLTFAADLFRWGTGPEGLFSYLTNQQIAVLGLVMFFSIFSFFSIVFYEKRLEGGGWE